MSGVGCRGAIVLALVLGPLPAAVHAQRLTPNAQRPSVILLLCEGLTLDDLENPLNPAVYAFAMNGQVGLMSAPVAGRKTDTAAMLAIAAGRLAPAENSDEEVFQVREKHPEGNSGLDVYRRRTGFDLTIAPVDHVLPYTEPAVHLGIAPLIRRGLANKVSGASASRGFRIAVAGNGDTDGPGRRIGLLGMNPRGIVPMANLGRECLEPDAAAPYGHKDSPRKLAAWTFFLADSDLVVIHLGDLARAESARPSLTSEQFADARAQALNRLDVLLKSLNQIARERGISPSALLVSTRPPFGQSGGWNRLSVAVSGKLNADLDARLLTSATTRTKGLISNLDITPTLLAWLGVPQPAHMTGHSITMTRGSMTDLRRMDALTRANADGIVPIFVVMGGIAAVAGFGGLLAVRLGRRAGWSALMMLVLSNFPLAMLLVVLLHPGSVIELGAATGVLMVGLAAVEYISGVMVHRRRPNTPATVGAVLAFAAFTVASIHVDALLGQYLIKFSLFSSYQVAGIRFYGIGNEYMGVLVGMALLFVFLGGLKPVVAFPLFIVTALVLGIPSLGADAGGLVAACVALGIGSLILLNRRADWRHALGFAVLGFMAAFLLAFIDRAVFGEESSHLGGAIQSAGKQGAAVLLEIIERKVRMNFAILFNPFTLTAIAGAAVVIILVSGPLRVRLALLVEQYPGWQRGLPAAGWGALAAFLFNDSGAVPAIFILGAFIASGLILLFTLPPDAISEP